MVGSRMRWTGLVSACATGGVLACTVFGRDGGEATQDAGARDGAGDSAASAPCDLGAPWGSPVQILFAGDGSEGVATLTEDELTIFFEKRDPKHATIYTAQRRTPSDPFTGGAEIAGVPSAQETVHPALSIDGLTLYVSSNRPPAGPFYRLWASTRASAAAQFTTPVVVTGLDDADGDDLTPFPTAADEVWFASTRGGLTANDIFFAAVDGGVLAAPVRAAEVSSPENDGKPVLTRDSLTLFFYSFRGLASGTPSDIWTASRRSRAHAFSPPVPVAELNTPAVEIPVWISKDACRLYLVKGVSADVNHLFVAARPRR